jgi:3'-phosphoadenosine 5'-phosphosulfate sulfotransferase (PAPS reductase)/FAD synthetase
LKNTSKKPKKNKNKKRKIGISFNGGKENIIIFYLCQYIIKNYEKENYIIFYFEIEDEFEEIKDFINETSEKFEFELIKINSKNGFKEGLGNLLFLLKKENLLKFVNLFFKKKKDKEIDCVVLGNRRDDPNCSEIKTFTESKKIKIKNKK